MNGYVEAGYVVGLGTLAAYAASLAVRERAARRRVGAGPADTPFAAGTSHARVPGPGGAAGPEPGTRAPSDPAPGDRR